MDEQAPKALVLVENLSKIVSTGADNVTVIEDVSFAAPHGSRLCISGPRGSGKSTVLRLLAALERPSSGSVVVADCSLGRLGDDAAARWRGRTVGMVLPYPHLVDSLTAEENVLLALETSRALARSTWRERARASLRAVGMLDVAHRTPDTLTAEQQQSVAIARAIANEPPLILADEPTARLHSQAGMEIFHLLEEALPSGTTLVYATCDSSLAERATERVQLRDGQVIELTYGAVPGIYA